VQESFLLSSNTQPHDLLTRRNSSNPQAQVQVTRMSSSNGSFTSFPSSSGTAGVDGSIHHGNHPHEDQGYQSGTESDGGDSGSEAHQTTGILESKSEALFLATVSELKAEQDCGSLRTRTVRGPPHR
jgi:hypothetical protein